MSVEAYIKSIESKKKEIDDLKRKMSEEREELYIEKAHVLGYTHKPKDLTWRQLEVLSVFTALSKEKGAPPGSRELNEQAGGGATGVRPHIKKLYEKGYLTDHEKPRYYYQLESPAMALAEEYSMVWYRDGFSFFDIHDGYINFFDVEEIEKFFKTYIKPEYYNDIGKYVNKKLRYPSTQQLYITQKAMGIMATV